jgi:iron complex outermembrane receptor protein
MNRSFLSKWPLAIPLIFCLLFVPTGVSRLHAQGGAGSIHGTVVDQSGHVIKGATVAVLSEAREAGKAVSNAEGKFDIAELPGGSYTVEISASGFSTVERSVSITAGANELAPVALSIASVSEEVTVEAEADNSLAAQLAPVKSLLDAGSARTEITSNYVSEYTSPVTDFADIIQAAPGTVSYTTNGIGNGQAKIFFRGFVDDDYSMTWDGVPFNDSNDPSHHSWAYVPAAAIGHVDFDRSPGTASDIGTSNFGGTIHFFSPEMSNDAHIRAEGTYGSFNTYQFLADINSGSFWHNKAHFWLNGDYQSSDGYQTFSPKQDEAITAKFDYKFSDRTYLSLIATDIILDAFNNNDPTRRQLFNHGDNYLYENNAVNPDGTPNAQYWRYSVYHVPSFFDVVTFNHEFSKGWKLDTKSYAYGYSNHQHYQNATDNDLKTNPAVGITSTIEEKVGGPDQPGWVTTKTTTTGGTTQVTTSSPTPTGINKLNQYGRGGEIVGLSYATKWGVFRTGSWYELTDTMRQQIYTDPLTWVDSPYLNDIKFHEHFFTHAVQPYVEFQLVSVPDLTLTVGVKSAFFRMYLNQYADGRTIGPLNCSVTTTTVSGNTTTTVPTLASACTTITTHAQNYNSILPSVEANYRLNSVASIYGQYGRGSIAPFSNVFDTTGAQTAVTPPPTLADTYQAGTVVKLNRLAFDMDAYHIHFQNTYSTYTDTTGSPSANPDYGMSYFYATPNSDTNGFEAEGNVAVSHALSFNANGTFGAAKYEAYAGAPAVLNASGVQITPAVAPSASSWVAATPHDTESVGMTYQQRGLDFGIFGKRIGSRWADIKTFHQVIPEDAFWMNNLFVNYNIRGNSIFDGSKVKLSINNLFDDHSIVAISAANDATLYNGVVGTKVTQSKQLYSPSWNDSIEKQAGRSIMITVQFGLTRHER